MPKSKSIFHEGDRVSGASCFTDLNRKIHQNFSTLRSSLTANQAAARIGRFPLSIIYFCGHWSKIFHPFHLLWGRAWIYYSIQSICLSDSFLEVPDELFRWKIDASARQLRGSRSEAKKERKYYLCETSHASAAAFHENKNKNNAKIYIDR